MAGDFAPGAIRLKLAQWSGGASIVTGPARAAIVGPAALRDARQLASNDLRLAMIQFCLHYAQRLKIYRFVRTDDFGLAVLSIRDRDFAAMNHRGRLIRVDSQPGQC